MKVQRAVFSIIAMMLLVIAATAQLRSNWANYDGSKIHYYDVGKGSNAIVLIHGWTCNADFWKDSISAFQGRRVIALDLPGHGKSDKPKVGYTMEYFARSVEAVMRAAKVDHAVLVGHSMGTPIARQFYRIFPDKVRGIVIVDGSLTPFFSNEQAQQLLAAFRKDYKGTSTQFVNGMLPTIKSDAIKKQITGSMLTAQDYVGISAMEAMMDDRIWAPDAVKVPVLAIMAQGQFLKPNAKEEFRVLAPDLDFQVWPDVSHFLMMEKPTEFNRAVAVFINQKKLL